MRHERRDPSPGSARSSRGRACCDSSSPPKTLSPGSAPSLHTTRGARGCRSGTSLDSTARRSLRGGCGCSTVARRKLFRCGGGLVGGSPNFDFTLLLDLTLLLNLVDKISELPVRIVDLKLDPRQQAVHAHLRALRVRVFLLAPVAEGNALFLSNAAGVLDKPA